MTLSTAEADYIAIMADAVKDALFLRDVFIFLAPSEDRVGLVIDYDNQGTIEQIPRLAQPDHATLTLDIFCVKN